MAACFTDQCSHHQLSLRSVLRLYWFTFVYIGVMKRKYLMIHLLKALHYFDIVLLGVWSSKRSSDIAKFPLIDRVYSKPDAPVLNCGNILNASKRSHASCFFFFFFFFFFVCWCLLSFFKDMIYQKRRCSEPNGKALDWKSSGLVPCQFESGLHRSFYPLEVRMVPALFYSKPQMTMSNTYQIIHSTLSVRTLLGGLVSSVLSNCQKAYVTIV